MISRWLGKFYQFYWKLIKREACNLQFYFRCWYINLYFLEWCDDNQARSIKIAIQFIDIKNWPNGIRVNSLNCLGYFWEKNKSLLLKTNNLTRNFFFKFSRYSFVIFPYLLLIDRPGEKKRKQKTNKHLVERDPA